MTKKNAAMQKIRSWDAVRSGAGLTINGVDVKTSMPVKLTCISRISSMPFDGGAREFASVATDKNGVEYALI